MKVKTEKLTGAALDWAVALAEGLTVFVGMNHTLTGPAVRELGVEDEPVLSPSSDWTLSGALIERESISLFPNQGGWFSSMVHNNEVDGTVQNFIGTGSSPLLAALRCFVAKRIGDEVDLPLALVEVMEKPRSSDLPADNAVDSDLLDGAALNWAVAQCVEQPVFWHDEARALYMGDGPRGDHEYSPSTNWEQGGSLVEHYKIDASWDEDHREWTAFSPVIPTVPGSSASMGRGSTALEASMRALVASHLGCRVQVPVELVPDGQVIRSI